MHKERKRRHCLCFVVTYRTDGVRRRSHCWRISSFLFFSSLRQNFYSCWIYCTVLYPCNYTTTVIECIQLAYTPRSLNLTWNNLFRYSFKPSSRFQMSQSEVTIICNPLSQKHLFLYRTGRLYQTIKKKKSRRIFLILSFQSHSSRIFDAA